MSKKIYIPTLLVIFFTALVFLGPQLLDIDTVRSKVASVISAKSGWRLDAAQLDWYWLPTPHFSLRDTTISQKGILLTLPETRIFPLWWSLLRQKIELQEVKLIKPELRIKSLPGDSNQPEISLPTAKITVIDGSVILSDGLFAGPAHLFPLTISEIDATVNMTPDRGEFRLSGKSPHFAFMELAGEFTPANHGFRIDYEINSLQAHNLFPAMENKRLLPIKSTISLQGRITGSGTEQFDVSLNGDFPCFIAPSETEPFLLDCGEADLTIRKNGADLTIDINALQLKNPGLVLSGKIARSTAKNGPEGTLPLWLVDLTGKDLDLTAIRKGVLTLWGDLPLAHEVCDIVLGGRAKQASFHFEGPLTGFKSIQQMEINVDVEEAEIHPPATPLFLTKAAGAIEIKDGYLSGHGLRARLGTSKGDNCSLFLDLADRKNEFRLDLDIDADLTALPKVLREMVPHQRFLKELGLISNVQGRATAHLNIGEFLHAPKVKVNINSINGSAKYEPMADPFRIRSGSLDIFPGGLQWRNIRGVVGPHMIRDSAGKISWEREVRLEIGAMQATFDAAALLRELNKASALPAKIAATLNRVEGVVELNNATMTGPLKNPAKWLYTLDLATTGSRWTSPLLPRTILAERVRAKISQNQIDLISGKIWFLEQPLLLEGSFSHSNFSNWQFWTVLSGTIREPLAEWLREKNWIPKKYFPVIPCTLDKLKIQWAADSLNLSGAVAAGMGGITSPSVRLQLESDKNHLKINKLIVSSPEEQGHLTLEYLKDIRRLNASWQGFIRSETILTLLNENILPADRLEGDFSIKYSPKPETMNFSGWAKTHNMSWFTDQNNHDLKVRYLSITGEDDGLIKLNQAIIEDRGDKLDLNGQITVKAAEINFDLGLEAEKVNGRTVNQVVKDLKDFAAEHGDRREQQPPSSSPQLKGVMHFKTGIFTSGSGTLPDSKKPLTNYILSPANGFTTIDSAAGQYSLDLRNSKICGLDISGTLNARESNHESSLTIFTDSSTPPLFKDVIPCFGFNNTMIDGNIHLDVNLKGTANSWQSGKADLYSDGGYIHRLAFLSKVFRVLNLRDIFSGVNMPDFANKGFAYTRIDITSHVEDNKLIIDKALVDGEGLNIFGQGSIDLTDWSADLTIMLAPLKSVDAIITNIPLIGKVVGGKDKAVISIPVAIKGDLRDPKVTILPPEAIGKGLLNLVANTLMMPFQILSPLLPDIPPPQ